MDTRSTGGRDLPSGVMMNTSRAWDYSWLARNKNGRFCWRGCTLCSSAQYGATVYHNHQAASASLALSQSGGESRTCQIGSSDASIAKVSPLHTAYYGRRVCGYRGDRRPAGPRLLHLGRLFFFWLVGKTWPVRDIDCMVPGLRRFAKKASGGTPGIVSV